MEYSRPGQMITLETRADAEESVEIWKDIPNYEGIYQASTFGKIKGVDRIIRHKNKGQRLWKGNYKHPTLNNKGYLKVTLYKNGKGTTREVQRWIAETFIPNPFNKEQVNHIDGNKQNNNINNLEWTTPLENTLHSRNVLGKCLKAVDQFSLNGDYIATYKSIKEASQKTNTRRCNISLVIHGKRNKAGGYIWKMHLDCTS